VACFQSSKLDYEFDMLQSAYGQPQAWAGLAADIADWLSNLQ